MGEPRLELRPMSKGRWRFYVAVPGQKRALYASRAFEGREQAQHAAAALASRLELQIVELEARTRRARRRR